MAFLPRANIDLVISVGRGAIEELHCHLLVICLPGAGPESCDPYVGPDLVTRGASSGKSRGNEAREIVKNGQDRLRASMCLSVTL